MSCSGAVVALVTNPDPPVDAAEKLAGQEAGGELAPLDVQVPDHVDTVRPALKATLPDGISDQVMDQVRAIAGVGASARILLTNITVEVPGGDALVSIAAVQPDEFRPLAPDATAQAKFVWEGLHRSQTLIAHEQYQIFGGKPLQTLAAKGPNGRGVLKIGGLASSGVPNLAGALMSIDQANSLGLGNPTMLLVGLNQGARSSEVAQALRTALPGVNVEPTNGTRTFYAGTSAQKAIGNFRYTTNGDGTITQDRAWVAQHVTSRAVPLLGEVTCHRIMLPQLEGALTEIRDSGLSDAIKPAQYGGCYAPRFIQSDGTKPLSMHAWGLAVDINVAENPPGARPKMDPKVVEIMERWGFRWGGRWSPPDGHHFELAALISS